MENLKELSILSLSPNAAAQEDGVYYACVWPFMGFDRQSEQSETAVFAGVWNGWVCIALIAHGGGSLPRWVGFRLFYLASERGRGCAAIQETPTIRPVMLPMRNIQRRRPEENDLQSRDFMTLYIRERWLKLHIHPSHSFLSSHATTTFTNSPLVMHLLFQADCFPQLRQAPSALYIFLYS